MRFMKTIFPCNRKHNALTGGFDCTFKLRGWLFQPKRLSQRARRLLSTVEIAL